MGRVKSGKLSRTALLKSAAGRALPTPPPPAIKIDVEEALQTVQHLMLQGSLDDAKALNQTILRQEPKNIKALESIAMVELELGEPNKARKHFLYCFELEPQRCPPSIHLYLAQLTETSEEALKHYNLALVHLRATLDKICEKRGVAAIIAENDNGKDRAWDEDEAECRRSCSRALVGMTEEYLTDLCFDPLAEEKCIEYLGLAASLDPTDPEPLTTLASVRLSQCNTEAASEALLMAWSLWRDSSSSSSASDGGGNDNDVDDVPPLASRMQWAKLALECELYGEAVEVLQSCEAEHDEDGEVLYLLGVAWHMMGVARSEVHGDGEAVEMCVKGNVDAARVTIGAGLNKKECWIESQEYLESCVKLFDRLGDGSNLDKEMMDHIRTLAGELSQAGVVSAAAEEETEGGDDGGGEGWTDASEDEDVDMRC